MVLGNLRRQYADAVMYKCSMILMNELCRYKITYRIYNSIYVVKRHQIDVN